MKLNKVLLGLCAAGLFAACSSDDIMPNNQLVADGANGYITFGVHQPTVPSNRANDQFDDGLASEYDVKDATLILFGGDDEATATVQSAYDITSAYTGVTDDPNQITVNTKITKKVTVPSGDQKFALVVLNNNGVIRVNGTGLMVNGVAFTGTLADLQQTVIESSTTDFHSNGFFMTNAPLADAVAPTVGAIKTLAAIDNTKIFPTANQSKEDGNLAAEIFVERGVAKVTLEKDAAMSNETTEEATPHKFEILGWYLDNTNPQSYLVRNTNDTNAADWWALKNSAATADEYRFTGSNVVKSGVTLYRTYFAEDPNFDAPATLTTTSTIADDAWMTTFGTETPAYCFENTFDVANMIWSQTTRVVLKVQFNEGKDFYILNGNTDTMYDKANIEKMYKAQIIKRADIKAAAQEAGVSLNESTLSVTLTETAGKVTMTDAEIVGGVFVYNFTDAIKAEINAALNVTLYKDGISYYQVRVKHFGDDQTPWNMGEFNNNDQDSFTAPTVADVYPGMNDMAYLGRYGMLRNNWYDINVKSLRTIGTAVVPNVDPTHDPDDPNDPTDPNTPDDEIEQYMSIEINVLSWAKRLQNVDL